MNKFGSFFLFRKAFNCRLAFLFGFLMMEMVLSRSLSPLYSQTQDPGTEKLNVLHSKLKLEDGVLMTSFIKF